MRYSKRHGQPNERCVMKSVNFVDGQTVSRVHQDVRRASRNVQYSPDRHVHGGHFERHEQESGRSSRGKQHVAATVAIMRGAVNCQGS